MTWSTEFYSAATGGDYVGTLALEYLPDAVAPYAFYQLISAPGINDLLGADSAGSRRVQVTVWADSPSDAEVQALRIASAVSTSTLNLEGMEQRSLGRDASGVFGYAVDFMVWFDTP